MATANGSPHLVTKTHVANILLEPRDHFISKNINLRGSFAGYVALSELTVHRIKGTYLDYTPVHITRRVRMGAAVWALEVLARIFRCLDYWAPDLSASL